MWFESGRETVLQLRRNPDDFMSVFRPCSNHFQTILGPDHCSSRGLSSVQKWSEFGPEMLLKRPLSRRGYDGFQTRFRPALDRAGCPRGWHAPCPHGLNLVGRVRPNQDGAGAMPPPMTSQNSRPALPV